MKTKKELINDAKRILFFGTQAEADRINTLNIDGLYAVAIQKDAIKSANFSTLSGKEAFIWRAYNQEGVQFEQQILDAIKPFADSISAIKVDALELNQNQNVLDYLKKSENNHEAQVASVSLNLQDVEILHGVKAIDKRIEDSIAGKFKNIDFPGMPKLSKLSKALLPGTVTTIPGEAGSGKSFWNIENCWRWITEGNLKVKVLMLEDDQAAHQARALAQMAESSGLTDDEFIIKYPDYARRKLAENKDKLARFAQALECTRTGQMTLLEIGDWIIKQIKDGADIVCVDPITAAKPSKNENVWEADMIFLFRVKQIVERFGARLILFSHPRTGKAGDMSLAGIAGGAAYPRFSQTVIWIKNSEKVLNSSVYEGPAQIEKEHRQTFKILKSRHGKGYGMSVAADLNKDTSCMNEIGLIAKKSESGVTESVSQFETPKVIGGKQIALGEEKMAEFLHETSKPAVISIPKPAPVAAYIPVPNANESDDEYLF